MQFQPLPLAGQVELPATKLVGLTVSDVDSLEQCHGTWTTLAAPVKVKRAASWQSVLGTKIVTFTGFPALKVPCEAVKLMPLMPLLDAFHCKLPCSPVASPRVTVHIIQPLVNLSGLAISVGGTQLHVATVGVDAPKKVKLALAGQITLGITMTICSEEPGGSVPLAGKIETPSNPWLVTDQLRLR